jgi:hypothetical protein
VRLPLTIQAMPKLLNPRHGAFWMLAALVFGVGVLPFLVHLTGRHVLGEYAGGGAAGFFADYLQGLLTLRWYSWALALGPVLILSFWRVMVFGAPKWRG